MGSGLTKQEGGAGLQRLKRAGSQIAIPRLVRAGSDEEKKGFFGIHLDFKGDGGVEAPRGCTFCNCEPVDFAKVEASPDLVIQEYIEEDVRIGVGNYKRNDKRSGPTQRGGKYMGKWYHLEAGMDIPKGVKSMRPQYSDGEWVEQLHVTKWFKFADPYTHQKGRFRVWRRIERTSMKPKPVTTEEPTAEGAEGQAPASEESPREE